MLLVPFRIWVEADYFSLWQFLPDTNSPKGHIVRPILQTSQFIPEEIWLRADNWGYWFIYELSNQGFPYKPISLDAEGFNKIGREIASSIKLWVGIQIVVGYRPILPDGGYGKIETVYE